MPIVSGNEPERQEGGRGVLWLLPLLLVVSRPLANVVQQVTGWTISPLQMVLAGGLVLGAAWLLWPNARGGRRSAPPGAPAASSLPARLPTPSTPSRSPAASSSMPGGVSQPGGPNAPQTPGFEPYVTGKVVLVGFVLLLFFAAVVAFIVMSGL